MELENVKQVFINEGEVKKILNGDTVIWQKNNVIHLTKSKAEPVTDFQSGWYSEVTFHAEYDTTIGTPEWSVSGLPEGLSYIVTDDGLMIYGYASEPGTHEVAVTASLNGYSDTRKYIFNVESSEYGIDIVTSNEGYITDFELNKYASKTFEAVFNVPPEEQDSEEVWSFKNLPDGLSASGSTISGTVTKKGTGWIHVRVTKGSYHKQKSFNLARYGIEVYCAGGMSSTALPNGKQGESYSTTLHASRHLPSDVGDLRFYASNLPAGLSLDSSTGKISGTPTTSGTFNISVYATQSPYTSATRTLTLTITASSRFTETNSDVSLLAWVCRDKDFIGSTIEYLDIYGSGFSQCQYIIKGKNNSSSIGSADVIVAGDSSGTLPVVTVSVNVVNDNQLTLEFVLKKRSTAGETALINRGKEIITILMCKDPNWTVVATHTVGIGFC